jgi:hypothetical protein
LLANQTCIHRCGVIDRAALAGLARERMFKPLLLDPVIKPRNPEIP